MTHTRMSSFLGVLALAAALAAPAPAQESYSTVAFDGASSETAELRAEILELRNKMNARTSGGYENGCGCNAGGGCGGDACCEPEEICGTWGGFEPCCHCTGAFVEAELMFLRYHRADGVAAGFPVDAIPTDTEFDFETAPRLTVGYVRCDGLGARLRWFDYNHAVAAARAPIAGLANITNFIAVDTYTLDFEVFDTFAVNRNWDLELAWGLRYVEFEEDRFTLANVGAIALNATRSTDFTGWGGVASAELRRAIGECGNLFLRARGSVVMSDKDDATSISVTAGPVVAVNPLDQKTDVTQGMLELAMGYQYTVPICGGGYYFFKVQAEWQNWFNFATTDVFNPAAVALPLDGGPSDVGFGGFSFGVGIAR